LIFATSTIITILFPDIYFIPKFLPIELFLISAAVSIIVGVLAGLIPAIRAAQLSPVDALRFEN
jgi:ABC-type antimicrobial peptide transport system permease subunit